MASPSWAISVSAPRVGVCLRLLAVIFILVIGPAESHALDAYVRWSPSPDARVQGYYVYVREAAKPYGAPRNAGSPVPAADGTRTWLLTGLSPTATYFIAVSAYTATGLQSALSNEVALGTPNPCVVDTCSSPTQCTVTPRPDGASCGWPAGATCGPTCLAGVCSGPADRGLTVDRLKVKRTTARVKVVLRGRFARSVLFAPQVEGLRVLVAAPDGTPVVEATLAPTDLTNNADASLIKALRPDDAAPVTVRRLLARTRDDETRMRATITGPPSGALPSGATAVIESGALCLSAQPLTCLARTRTLTCR